MSRFWPHTPLAEDQPLSHSILYVHTLTRGLTTGTIVAPLLTLPIYTLRRLNILSPTTLSLSRTLLRSSSTGAVAVTLLMLPGTALRMWGMEEIEWKDRAWRLLENKGQVECDDWTYAGMAGGVVAGLRANGWKARVGTVGMGSVVGTLGYMGWRHGVKGGKFEESDP